MRLKYKEDLDKYMPELRQDIFKQIISINERNSVQKSLESQNRRIESLKWLYLQDDQIHDSLKCSLQLTRSFLLEQNIDGATKLHNDLVSSLFQKVVTRKIDDDYKTKSYFDEKESYVKLFDAHTAHQNYIALTAGIHLPESDQASFSSNMILEQQFSKMGQNKGLVDEKIKVPITNYLLHLIHY